MPRKSRKKIVGKQEDVERQEREHGLWLISRLLMAEWWVRKLKEVEASKEDHD